MATKVMETGFNITREQMIHLLNEDLAEGARVIPREEGQNPLNTETSSKETAFMESTKRWNSVHISLGLWSFKVLGHLNYKASALPASERCWSAAVRGWESVSTGRVRLPAVPLPSSSKIGQGKRGARNQASRRSESPLYELDAFKYHRPRRLQPCLPNDRANACPVHVKAPTRRQGAGDAGETLVWHRIAIVRISGFTRQYHLSLDVHAGAQ